MLIEAILRFKHARVMQVLKANNLTIKKLAEMSGWNQTTLGNFLRLQTVPKDKTKYSALFEALQVLDPMITHEEVFPEYLKKAVEVFTTRKQTTDVNVLQLADRSVDMLALEDHSMHADDSVNSCEQTKELRKALGELLPREVRILEMYYGLDNDGEKTLDEIGIALSLSSKRTRLIRDRALLKLFKNPEVRIVLGDLLDIDRSKWNGESEAKKRDKEFRKWLGYVPRAEVVTVWSELMDD